MKSKKPSRPPSAKQTSINNKTHRKSETENLSSTNSSREKLNGSSDRLTTPLKKTAPIPFVKAASTSPASRTQPASLPPSSASPEKSTAKKHSFGKSTPPPKPKPPSFTNKGSSNSLNDSNSSVPKEKKEPSNVDTTNMKNEDLDLDLDQVLRSDDKLAHLTAERVKAPKRRPPSSVFQKEAVSNFRTLCVCCTAFAYYFYLTWLHKYRNCRNFLSFQKYFVKNKSQCHNHMYVLCKLISRNFCEITYTPKKSFVK